MKYNRQRTIEEQCALDGNMSDGKKYQKMNSYFILQSAARPMELNTVTQNDLVLSGGKINDLFLSDMKI